MRIEAYSQIQQLYNTSKANSAGRKTAASADFRDRLQISNAGKDMQTAKMAVANAPDVRADRVAAIKSALADGTYNVSGDDFADRIMERLEQTRA